MFPTGTYNSITLGAESLGNNYMNGYINDFRLFNQFFSMTDQTPTQIYNLGLNVGSTYTNLDNDVNLISYYAFNNINVLNVNGQNNTNAQNNVITATLSNILMIPLPSYAQPQGRKIPSSNRYIIFPANTLSVALETNINITSSYTICFWIYCSNGGNILTLYNDTNIFINFQTVSDRKVFLTINNNGSAVQIIMNNALDTAWNHISIVFNQFYDFTNNVNCYINSILCPINNTNNNINLYNLKFSSTLINTIGATPITNLLPTNLAGIALNNNSFMGGFTDLRIFTRGLTSSEINIIYTKP
jgi:hypothetical protein